MKCIPGKGYMTRSELLAESAEDREKRYAAMRKEDAENRKITKARERVQQAEAKLVKSEKYARGLVKNPCKGVVAVDRRRAELQRVVNRADKVYTEAVGKNLRGEGGAEAATDLNSRKLLSEAIRRDLAYKKGVRVC